MPRVLAQHEDPSGQLSLGSLSQELLLGGWAVEGVMLGRWGTGFGHKGGCRWMTSGGMHLQEAEQLQRKNLKIAPVSSACTGSP